MIFRPANVLILFSILLSAGCAQFTTNPDELAALKNKANAQEEAYITCVKTQAADIYSTTDPGFIRDAVMSRCGAERQAFEAAEKEALQAQYMVTDKAMKVSMEQLDERARTELAETLLARPPAAGSTAVNAPPPVITAPAASGAPISWSPEQRIYLDCMEDQAEKYALLEESVEAIADVAVSRCRMYLGTQSVVALEREGRAQVMGKVMDMRLGAAGQ